MKDMKSQQTADSTANTSDSLKLNEVSFSDELKKDSYEKNEF